MDLYGHVLSVLCSLTLQNVAKAQAEIDRLEAEAQEAPSAAPFSSNNRRTHDSGKRAAIANQSVNGAASAEPELTQEKDADANVAEDMKKASIDDKEDE